MASIRDKRNTRHAGSRRLAWLLRGKAMITIIDVSDLCAFTVARAMTFEDKQERDAMDLFKEWVETVLADGEEFDELWYADGKYEVGDGGIYVVVSKMGGNRGTATSYISDKQYGPRERY